MNKINGFTSEGRQAKILVQSINADQPATASFCAQRILSRVRISMDDIPFYYTELYINLVCVISN